MGSHCDYTAVTDVNRPHPVVGRRAGVVLHARGGRVTVGSVSVREGDMAHNLRRLDPARSPRFVLGARGWFAA